MLITHDPATHAVAQQDDMLAYRLAENHVVKSSHTLQLRRSHLQSLGHVRDAFIRHPAAMLLYDLERLDAYRAILRVVPRVRLYFPSSPVRSALFPSVQRSTSAMTKSMLPRMAIKSEIISPRLIKGNHLQMRKGRRANPHAVRHGIAVADQVIAIVPLGRFDAHECFPGRNDRPPAHTQEMVDERFDVMQGLLP